MSIKNLVVVLLATVAMLLSVNAHADTFKAGSMWVDGHSYDGSYGVNNKGDQSWGFGISYDRDGIRRDFGKHQAIGLDYGAMLNYFRITITKNAKSSTTVEERDAPSYPDDNLHACATQTDGYQAHGKGDYKVETVNSLLVGVYPKAWYELYGVRVFIAPIVGAELADDGESSIMGGGMAGFEKLFSKHFGASIQHAELWTTKRRFDATSINFMVRF